MLNTLAVGLGGFLGSVLRYLIGQLPIEHDSGFPLKTFLINVTGAFVIGLITAAAAKNKTMSPQMVLFLKTGICGGFTTFSTFALESADLMKAGHNAAALVYILSSAIFGILAVFAANLAVGA